MGIDIRLPIFLYYTNNQFLKMSAASDTKQYLAKKAYEIAYAIFRMSSSVKKESFRNKIEDLSLSLLELAAKGDDEDTLEASKTIEFILRFGADVGIVNSANVQTISEELKKFNTAIAEFKKQAKLTEAAEVALENIFSDQPKNISDFSPAVNFKENHDNVINHQDGREELIDEQNGNHNSIVKSAMRQSAILERIRQNDNCRLKEIQELLPNVSERTLRYDVQNLLGSGLIERVGNGGPATHYKAKDPAQ